MDACPDERKEEIRRELSTLNLLSFALGLPGLMLQFGAAPLYRAVAEAPTTREEAAEVLLVTVLIRLVGIGMLVAGLWFNARYKGRGGAWGLLGLLSCIGMLVLYFLPKRCHHCGTPASMRATACPACTAPM